MEKIDLSITPTQFKVKKIVEETKDTITVELIPPNNYFQFLPGQFNMLYFFGVGEIPISISGDSSKSKSVIHTIRKVGSVTSALSYLKKSDYVGARGPYGSNWPIENLYGKNVLIITGGIGLAPLRPTIYKILKERKKFEQVALLYGARTPSDILYLDELKKIRSRVDFDVYLTVDRAEKNWKGNVGVVTTLIPKISFDLNETIAFVCGPEIMMKFVIVELNKKNMNNDNIYISMERNMKCAVGVCGHCQYGSKFICKDGPIFKFSEIKNLFSLKEL